jgi:hypothetical protein
VKKKDGRYQKVAKEMNKEKLLPLLGILHDKIVSLRESIG